jgi:excisionase family DNA binding protein
MDKLYTLEEVCNYLRLGEMAVGNYLRSGKLKGTKIGKEWRIKETDLQTFVNGKSA